MKKITLLLASIFSVWGNSQTLTYATFSNSLSTSTSFVVGNLASFNTSLLTTVGSNVTWDASGLTQENGTPQVELIFGIPSATPHSSLFPTSNYVQYDPNLTTVISYQYVFVDADSLVMVGEYSPSTAHEIFQDPDKHLIFPFSFGENFADVYAKTNYSDATTISSFQTGTRTVAFAGYGTLILPQGTYTNVGLMSELRTNSLGPNSTEFTWYDLTTGKRLLYFAENNGDQNLAFNNEPISDLSENLTSSKLTVYPNPIHEKGIISFSQHLHQATIQFYDLIGKEIASLKNVTGNSVSLESINLTEGNYMIKILQDCNQISTEKLSLVK